MSSCAHFGQARQVTGTSRVYKDECTLCFDGPASDAGLDVCLTCFNGGCTDAQRNHSQMHFLKTSHPLVLNIKRLGLKQSSEAQQEITRVAIGVPGGASLEQAEYDYAYTVRCLACNGLVLPEPLANLDAHLDVCVRSLISATSNSDREQIQAWEEAPAEECQHTQNLVHPQDCRKQLAAQNLAQCGMCDLKENLWLCLTCGQLGCGRRQYDGSGGNEHAHAHSTETGHPVALKLGTITPEGQADVHCYACSEMRVDPKLVQHLAHFGIRVSDQTKTARTMAEMTLAQNLSLTMKTLDEEGRTLQPVFGPGLTGLTNLGNSCYMASVLQVLFSFPHLAQRYQDVSQTHVAQCQEADVGMCYMCQSAKLADGLLSGRYSVPASNEHQQQQQQQANALAGTSAADQKEELQSQDGIAPRMFKYMIARNNDEFRSGRQQDAMEFFEYYLKQIQLNERRNQLDPTSVFWFKVEERKQCSECSGVRYTSQNQNSLMLPIPCDPSAAGLDFEAQKNFAATALKACFDASMGEQSAYTMEDFQCPQCKKRTNARISQGFKTFPDTLVLSMRRFVVHNWVPTKLSVPLSVPDEIDLSSYASRGLQANEVALPESKEPDLPPVNAEALSNLMAMGFSQVASEKALRACNNNAEGAINWVMEHMGDADLEVPPQAAQPTSSGPPVNEEALAMLTSMGFDLERCRIALQQTDNNPDRAIDWVMSHMDESLDALQQDLAPSGTNDDNLGQDDGRPPKYSLVAFVTHLGGSVHSGHYVAHVQKNGQWVLFNDRKVATTPAPPREQAYLYFFRKSSN